jgi:peptide/nickel transport system substrate-binding protein
MLDGDGDAILPTRRGFIQGATTAAALAGLPSVSTRALAASSRAKTLVVAAPATPLSLDVENSLSLGTIDTVGAFYDYLIAFDMVPDPKVPGAMRENLAPNPSAPGGYNLKGKLAESWEFAPDGKTARFKLREGVVSNYGNPLTADDVKYTFDRKFEVKGAGAFMTGVMGLSSKDQVKVEGERVVSFNLDKPNPILMIVCGHLANPSTPRSVRMWRPPTTPGRATSSTPMSPASARMRSRKSRAGSSSSPPRAATIMGRNPISTR